MTETFHANKEHFPSTEKFLSFCSLRRTYQHAPSHDARKEPHEAAEVVLRGILCFPIRKIKQNISYDAEDGEPHQRMSDAPGALAVAHGGGWSL